MWERAKDKFVSQPRMVAVLFVSEC